MLDYYLHENGVPFQQIEFKLSINSTEIGTTCLKITQQSQNFPLSNLRSPLSILRSTLTLLSFPYVDCVVKVNNLKSTTR